MAKVEEKSLFKRRRNHKYDVADIVDAEQNHENVDEEYEEWWSMEKEIGDAVSDKGSQAGVARGKHVKISGGGKEKYPTDKR